MNSMHKIILRGGPLGGHKILVDSLEADFSVGQPAVAQTLLAKGEHGRQLEPDEIPPMTTEEMNLVGSYYKTNRSVSGRVVYMWNEAAL